ncbi:MAG: amino acid adenylation domain-containing protein, partial [Candidatus Aminicenantes bacterium]
SVLYPKARTIYQVLEEQAEKTPGNIALVAINKEDAGAVNQEITYRELNQTSNQLARLLRAKGVNRGTIIAIMVERSPEMVAGIQAILKAGGAYLPIDPEYPDNRIIRMLEESGASMVLTGARIYEKRNLSSLSQKQEFLLVDELAGALESQSMESMEKLPPVSGPNDLIYIIFTSGSTGKPKGAGVYHRGFMNLMHWFVTEFELDARDSNLLLTSLSFDLTQKNLYAPLMRGGTLCIPGINYFEPHAILRQIQGNQVSWINCTPSMFYKLVEYEENSEEKRLTSLQYVFLGGEPISMTLLINWLESAACRAQIVNTYGPTECTDICASFRIEEPRRCLEEAIPVGRPVYNAQLFVVSKDLQLVPVGVPGELFIGGEGVGIGYVNDRELTSRKFIQHRFAPEEPQRLLYRTGDLVKWLSNGQVEFLGRMDHQVKVRGFRIELGEIENRLSTHKNVKEMIVIAKEGHGRDHYLCAYIIPHDRDTFREQELRDYLAEELPDYMVPAYFIPLEKMPLNPNGKVDRKALPEPDLTGGVDRVYVPPTNEIESVLVKIWAEVLGQDKKRIGVHDNFFQLGGHSLKAAGLISRIHKAFSVEIPIVELFKIPTVKAIGNYIDKTVESLYSPIRPVEKQEYYPPSSAQKRLYVLQQIEGAGTSYNIPLVLIVEGILDRTKLEETFKKLISHHESLRTSFEMIAGEPVQRVHHEVGFVIAHWSKVISEKKSIETIIRNFVCPFDLSQAPLLRVGLVKTGKNEHILMVDIHHIVSDGISTDIFIKEFTALYAGEKLPERMVQYKDFSRWQKSEKEKGSLREPEKYWLKKFEDEIPVLHLPTDFARPVIQSFAGNSITFEIGKQETGKLKELAFTGGATLYMVLLTIFNIFLARISGQEDIVVGTAVAGRRHPGLEKIIGMFVNTLVLRNFPQGNMTVKEFLTETRTRTLQAQENQDYPFEDLVEKAAANINRDAGRNPLFDVMFVLQNMHISEINIPGLKLTPYNYETQVSKFDLTFICEENEIEGIIHFTAEYSTKLFKKGTIQRWINYFKNILSHAADTPGKKIGELELISKEEKNQVLVDFNKTVTEYPKDKTIPELFEEQVEKTPHHIAVVGPQQVKHRTYMTDMTYISYRELNEKSNQLAYLLNEKGVQADIIVGIMAERSVEMVIGLLSILKAGGAYLPLDPEYPEERINYILTDAKVIILVKKSNIFSNFATADDIDVIVIDDVIDKNRRAAPILPSNLLPFCPSSPANLAYILYTSGSTGRPKGVPVQHGSVVNILWALFKKYPLLKEDTYLLKTTYTFDVSVSELFGWYIGGGRLAILEPGSEKDPLTILDWIQRAYVTHINFVPSMFGVFLEILDTRKVSQLSNLKYIFLAGETLPPHLVTRFNELNTGIMLENIYGPTENTIYASQYSLLTWQGVGSIPIGKPLNNIRAYILNSSDQLQPIGVWGELCIGGEGLARGYLNRPELTAEKFCCKSFLLEGTRGLAPLLYKTGDLARWHGDGDGNIEFLGRIDHQVKIRGFRIELGEIENQLLKHNKVREAVVLAGEDEKEDKYLCAYIVPDRSSASEAFDVNALRNDLLTFLPGYMIPAYFVELEQTPLTPTGKINKNALPKPVINPGSEYRAPGDEIERRLQRIWSEVLGIEKNKIGTRDNFFKLGGHSLKATIMISKIYREVHVKIPLGEVFRIPTIMGLARYIKSVSPSAISIIEPVELKEYYALSSAQKRLYILQ